MTPTSRQEREHEAEINPPAPKKRLISRYCLLVLVLALILALMIAFIATHPVR